MSDSHQTQIDSLERALAVLYSQRDLLGYAIEPAILATQEKLERLKAQLPAQDERRHITLFFSDVVGSVSLAEQLDPEDWRTIIGTVQHTIGTIVTAHGGMIAQYQGDGLIAFFGAHGLREQDVEQAVLAALDSQSAVPQLSLPVPIQLRIGIHTGLVLLGSWGAESKIEFAAFGDAVNTTARLQSSAPPGAVIISQDTYNYVRGSFEFQAPIPLALKGKSAPVQTYVVRRARPRVFHLNTRGVFGVQTHIIGREQELRELQSHSTQAFKEHRTAGVQLVGEAGVGKSRLLEEASARIEFSTQSLITLRGRAFEGEQHQPFALIRRMWFDRFQIAEDTPLATVQSRWVERFCELSGSVDPEPAQALGLLVGLPFEGSPLINALRNDPKQVCGRAIVVSCDVLHSIRTSHPLLVLLEDLHWADASSLSYLAQVLLHADRLSDLQGMFILATARAECRELSHPSIWQLPLQPLSETASQTLVRELLSKLDDLPSDVMQLIVGRAEGVPYFVEELVNYFLDRGIIERRREPWRFNRERLEQLHGSDQSPLPATLQYLLRARLDSLAPSERIVLQRGSIYGREFWTGGVHALGVARSEEILPILQPRGFVRAQSESAFQSEQEWSFHHALLRDATYDSVLKRERPALHQKAADWLENKAQESGRLEEFAGLLAEHRDRGGEPAPAAVWYIRAGERANRQGACAEARKFFDRALHLLSPTEQSLRWRVLVGRESSLGRLTERGLQGADIQSLLDLANALDDQDYRAWAYYSRARYLVAGGELFSALEPAEQALSAARSGKNLAMQAQSLATLIATRTRLGEPERARALVAEARECARTCGSDFTYAQTLMQIALHYTDAGDLAEAVEPYINAAEIARSIGNRALEGQTLSNLGYAYAQLGLYELARPALERTLTLAKAVGERRDHAYGLQNLGWTFLCSNDIDTARHLEEQALQEFTALSDAYGHAASVLYLGHIAERAGDSVTGARYFSDAFDEYHQIGVRGYMMDCSAGLARCALAQRQFELAHEHAAHLWKYLSEHNTRGIELPSLVFQTCAAVFSAVGESEKSCTAVQSGYDDLMTRAAKISNLVWRESFLTNVLEHRTMIEMWQRQIQ